VAFFFGQRAPIFSYQGTLINSYQDDWAMRMFRIFRDLGRGTQLARRGFLLRIRYDSMIVSGAMLNFNWTLNADMQVACPFSFNLLVKNIQVVLGGLSAPTQPGYDTSFAPAGFHLESPAQINTPPVQTLIGSPPTSPSGASLPDNFVPVYAQEAKWAKNKQSVDLNLMSVDPTLTGYQAPDTWDYPSSTPK
jgi:hypothetical protein